MAARTLHRMFPGKFACGNILLELHHINLLELCFGLPSLLAPSIAPKTTIHVKHT